MLLLDMPEHISVEKQHMQIKALYINFSCLHISCSYSVPDRTGSVLFQLGQDELFQVMVYITR